jgi:hypothetical protein
MSIRNDHDEEPVQSATVVESLPWWAEYARATGRLPDVGEPGDDVSLPWWAENPEIALASALEM